MLAQPNDTAVLGARVAREIVDGGLLADIPDANALVARRRDEQRAAGVPRQALDDIGLLEGESGLARGDVPELDGQIAGGGRQDVLGGGVEEDLSDLSRMRGWRVSCVLLSVFLLLAR